MSTMSWRIVDISGQRFGRLVVVALHPERERYGTRYYFALWRCRCDCGAECIARGSHLRGGKVTSCGCFQLQHARGKHVVFIGILDRLTDDFNRPLGFQVQMEGAKVPREIGAIVDEIIIMDWVKFDGRGEPTRAFICTSPNRWNYPAKDRSGRLDQIEEPHLGRLLTKIVDQRKPAATPEA